MMEYEKESYQKWVDEFFKKYPPERDLYGEIARLEKQASCPHADQKHAVLDGCWRVTCNDCGSVLYEMGPSTAEQVSDLIEAMDRPADPVTAVNELVEPVGESYHWHGDERCNCNVSFDGPQLTPDVDQDAYKDGPRWGTEAADAMYGVANAIANPSGLLAYDTIRRMAKAAIALADDDGRHFCPSCRHFYRDPDTGKLKRVPDVDQDAYESKWGGIP